MDLYTIKFNKSELKKLGLDASTQLNSLLRKKLDTLSVSCVNAFKTTVPVDLGSLRNQKIDYALLAENRDTLSSRVFVEDSPHLGRRSYIGNSGKIYSSSEIAAALQAGGPTASSKGGFARSHSSQPAGRYSKTYGPGSPTKGWITDGQNLFSTNYKRDLNG